jgi:hypothetical protein
MVHSLLMMSASVSTTAALIARISTHGFWV